MVDLFRGRRSSKVAEWIAWQFLLLTVVLLLYGRVRGAVMSFVAYVATNYLSYRLAGGRNNPELVKASWEGKSDINLVTDPSGSWEAKVTARFDLLEAEHRGDWAAAAQSLQFRDAPAEVNAAHRRALTAPSRETWTQLRDTLIANPPVGHR